MIGGSFEWNIVCLTNICTLLQQPALLVFFAHSPIMCILLILFKCGTRLFTFISIICNNRTFHATNEMCNLVSTWLKPIHITSTRLCYIKHRFIYFRCISMFYVIFGLMCCKNISRGSHTIASLPMLVDPHVTFAMLSICYA